MIPTYQSFVSFFSNHALLPEHNSTDNQEPSCKLSMLSGDFQWYISTDQLTPQLILSVVCLKSKLNGTYF